MSKEMEIITTEEEEERECESERVSIFGASFGGTVNLVATAIGGGGMLGNIFGASELGIFGYLFVVLLNAFFTYLSIEFLVISSILSGKKSCYELCEQYLGGKKGNYLTRFFIIFGNWSFVVNVIQIFADFMSLMLTQIFLIDANSFLSSREFSVILGLIFIFPWIQSKNIKSLEKLSGAFVCLSIIILLIIVVNAFKASLINNVAASIQMGPTDYSSFFRGLPAITWCWTIQFNVLPVFNTMPNINRQRTMSNVSYWSVICLFCYYVMFGFSALIIWGSRINDDFLTNLSYKDSNYVFLYGIELSTTTQFIMCIITFSSIPMFSFEARTNSHYILMDVWYRYKASKPRKKGMTQMKEYKDESRFDENDEEKDETTPLKSSDQDSLSGTGSDVSSVVYEDNNLKIDYSENWISRLIESGVIICSAAVVALYLTNLNWCLSLVGATYGCYIAYFVPSVIYWNANKDFKQISVKRQVLKYLAIVSVVYGAIVCVLGIAMAFVV